MRWSKSHTIDRTSPHPSSSLYPLRLPVFFPDKEHFYYLKFKYYIRPLHNKDAHSPNQSQYLIKSEITYHDEQLQSRLHAETDTKTMRPFMLGKSIPRRSLQSRTDLRKEVSVLHPLKRGP
jgi:hypothetical protein